MLRDGFGLGYVVGDHLGIVSRLNRGLVHLRRLRESFDHLVTLDNTKSLGVIGRLGLRLRYLASDHLGIISSLNHLVTLDSTKALGVLGVISRLRLRLRLGLRLRY
ncbi:MAG: hypothetical protein QOJ28_96, partial [Mycobacterium sp.]|nr:hypothetical protein [Mycobacterium sp.]